MADPFGLGAVEAASGGSWLNQIGSGLGVDNSMAAQQGRQDALVGAVNLATMGLANDASSAVTGYDLSGNRTTRQEQLASAVMLGLALIPGEDVEATASRTATKLGEVAAEGGLFAGRAGSFGELDALAVVGDDLTPHHMPQAALSFTTRDAGGAIMLATDEHVLTRTYGFNGAVLAQQEAELPFRTVLAWDIRNLRGISGSQYNQGIQNLLQYYRQNFPQLMAKPGRP